MTAKLYLFPNQKIEVHAMVDYWAEKGYQIRYMGRKLRLVPAKRPVILPLLGPRTTNRKNDK